MRYSTAICRRDFRHSPKKRSALPIQYWDFFSTCEDPVPTMYLRDGTPFFFAPIPFGSIHANATAPYDTMNALVDSFYGQLIIIAQLGHKRAGMHKRVAKQIDKLSHVLKKQLETIRRAEKAEKHKASGDIITANIYRIRKGMRTLEAEDFTTGQPVSIPLDTRLSPSANAQKKL